MSKSYQILENIGENGGARCPQRAARRGEDTHALPAGGTGWRWERVSRLPVLGLLLALALGLSSCTPAKPIAESDYGAKIVGNWLGTVGDMKESITFSADGSFIAQLRPQGFISNTLSQGVTGTIRGTWTIDGKTITLKITSAEDERVKNSVTSSTILAFSQDELTMKSSRGDTSKFVRAISL